LEITPSVLLTNPPLTWGARTINDSTASEAYPRTDAGAVGAAAVRLTALAQHSANE